MTPHHKAPEIPGTFPVVLYFKDEAKAQEFLAIIRKLNPGISDIHTLPPIVYKFRAGDVVRHRPTGEKWVLANDEEDGRVSPCGWPCSMADAKDCALLEKASDERRLETLTRLAGLVPDERDGPDHRVNTARRQLKDFEAGREAQRLDDHVNSDHE